MTLENEMGGTCSMHGKMRNIYRLLLENLKGRGQWRDISADGRIIVALILKKLGLEGVDWFKLAQDKVQWRAVANTVTKLQVS
jgi:hypothetical protein